MTLPRPVEPELMTVGVDEIVVTAESGDDVTLTTRVGGREVVTTGPHHVARITGLEPDTQYELAVSDVEPHPYLPSSVRTLARPAGRLLATIATANDVHFGETVCGATGDPAQDVKGPLLMAAPGDPPYPTVMNAAVIDEMRALGPDVVVVKGDLTARGSDDEYRAFLAAYGALGSTMHHVRGNHDAMLDPTMAIQDAPYVLPVDGVTLAVLDTVIPGTDAGQLSAGQLRWLDELAAHTTGPVLAFGHHPCFDVEHGIRTGRPYFGIQPGDSDALVDVVARHDNLVGYFAGHTHRNRVRRFERARRVPFGEIACTKDYPGAWAEYRVYEGGYTQVMRRVAAPDAFAWAERTRGLYEGVYRDYALGPLEHRSFTEVF
ncbi:MAG TPA: metallophosphoesterase family protein [Acidimicrobiia bacterium]|jgi:predicted phosphodiesterase